jgi:hypothetical protein
MRGSSFDVFARVSAIAGWAENLVSLPGAFVSVSITAANDIGHRPRMSMACRQRGRHLPRPGRRSDTGIGMADLPGWQWHDASRRRLPPRSVFVRSEKGAN